MAKSQKQLREEAEMQAAELRAQRAMEVAEAEAAKQQEAKEAYDDIWAAFSKDLKNHGKSYANANLLDNLTIFASLLVPLMMTAKEHTSLIMDLSEKQTSDKGASHGENPTELVSSWLRGAVDLSRIPLEKAKVLQ